MLVVYFKNSFLIVSYREDASCKQANRKCWLDTTQLDLFSLFYPVEKLTYSFNQGVEILIVPKDLKTFCINMCVMINSKEKYKLAPPPLP